MKAHDGLKTFEEIGREMGISKSRVCQIYKRAMKKLRYWAERDPAFLEAFDVVINRRPPTPRSSAGCSAPELPAS